MTPETLSEADSSQEAATENERLSAETPAWSLRRKSDTQRYALWDALADFGGDAIGDDALQFCMREIASLIRAPQAFWSGTVRVGHAGLADEDPYKGWRLGAWVAMDHTNDSSPEWMRTAARIFNNKTGVESLGAPTRRVLAQTGCFRVFALSKGMVDLDAFRQTECYDHFYRQQGIVDRIWIAFPVNQDSESCFCFDRFAGQADFDKRDITTASEALRGIKWFHRALLLGRGLGVAKESLTPAERGIVRELLTGATEKVIADRLQLTPASAHQYVVRVYRKFGVRGRSEFMALWLGTRS